MFLAFARFAEAVALDGLGENHRRLAFVFHRGLVGRINFARVVAAAQQLANLLVAQMIHQFEQFGIFAEEMLARVAARLDGIFLIIAVHASSMRLSSRPVLSRASNSSHSRAPDDLDDIPARAAEKRFEFLDDFAVAAHRAVEPLQIAIDDPDQVVEIFARARA